MHSGVPVVRRFLMTHRARDLWKFEVRFFSKTKSSPETFSKDRIKSDKKQNRKFEVSLFNVTRPNFNYQTVFQSFFREPQKFGVRLVFATQKLSQNKLKRDKDLN